MSDNQASTTNETIKVKALVQQCLHAKLKVKIGDENGTDEFVEVGYFNFSSNN